MTPLEEARREILDRLAPLPPETVPLLEGAGRFLAKPLVAADSIPPFDNTSMDGFALRSRDVEHAAPSSPVRLQVVAVVEAGSDPRREIGPGEAARIFTGAALPPGIDAVVPFEETAESSPDEVVLTRPVPAGHSIRRRGSDVKEGEEALPAGTRLRPATIGLLANLGCVDVPVTRRLRVAVHSSGDELVPIDERLTPGKIRNSNLYSLCARLARWGATPLPRPVLRDDPDAVRQGLRQTLALRPDAILTTGGISAGDLDHIREVARELGDDVQVRKVRMKPGKPLVDGKIGGVPFFGLPGNPAASLVSFEIFVRPALAHLEGRPDGLPPRRQARVARSERLRGGSRLQYLRGRVRYDGERGEYVLEPLAAQESHLLSSFARANCLVEVHPEVTELAEGARVEVLLLDP